MESLVRFAKSLFGKSVLPVGLLVLVCAPNYSQNATTLQQQGVQRIDSFIEHYRKTGDYKSLIPQLQQAESELMISYKAFLKDGSLAPAALTLIKLGMAQRLQQRWSQAHDSYQQAYEVARQAKQASYQAKALNGLAMVELNGLRDYQAAAVHLEEAISLTSKGEDKQALFDALDLKGSIQEGRGELIAAADTMNRAQALAAQMNDPVSLYFAFLDRASIYQRLAGTCDPKTGFEQCSDALNHAQSDFEQGRAIATRLEYSHLASEMDGFLRRLELRRQLLQSEKGTSEAVTRYRIFNPTQPDAVAVSEQFLARGKIFPSGSESMVQEMSRRYAGDAVGYNLQGLLLLNLGQDEAATPALMKAVELLEADRRSLRDGMPRGSFLEDKIEIYYYAILDLLDRRRFSEAFDLMERAKARSMTDLLRSQELKLTRPDEQKLYAESVNLDANISRLQKELFNLNVSADSSRNAEQKASVEREIQKLESEHQKFSERVVTQRSKLQELVVPPTASLSQLQQTMRHDGFEVLTYLVLKGEIVLWHISGDAVNVRSIVLPRAELVKKVSALRQSLIDPNVKFDQQTAREMFLFLIQPALRWIKSEHLVIIPHDELNYVPFQVFQNPADSQFLGDRFQISYAPNASALLRLKTIENIREGRLLAVADPTTIDGQDEVRAISKLYPERSETFSTPLIQEAKLKSLVGNYNLVHLSVHGDFNAKEPMLSHLVLSKGGADDGMLSAAEMFGLPLAPNSLVVLSACDTGQAQATRANEILGMVRGLLYAGANNMVLSSWRVDAASTALWMETFYREAQSRKLSDAARLALLTVKKNPQYSHPYYWSPFLLIGK
jgi:CHAT domain-containing protein